MAYITNDIKTVTGTNIAIQDSDQKEIVDLTLQGNTTQETTPTPDAPQPINVVSGRQEINIHKNNLLDLSKFEFITTDSGITIENDTTTGKVVLNGTATKDTFARYRLPTLYTGEVVSLSANNPTVNSNVAIRLYNTEGALTTANIYLDTVNKVDNNRTLTLAYNSFQIRIANGTTLTNFELYPQVEKGSATEYEVYKGKSYEINLGKNILDTSTITSGTTNGIDYENNNGTITLDGTATANSYIATWSSRPYILEAGTYTISANNETAVEGTNNYIRLVSLSGTAITGTSANFTVANNKTTFTLTEETTARLQIRTNQGTTYDKFVIRPMLEKGSQATPYSPYKTPIELCKIGNYQDFIKKGTGKNLFKPFNFTKTNNGITFTYNIDGSINVNNTSTGTALSMYSGEATPYLIQLSVGTYTISGNTTDIRLEVVNNSGTSLCNTGTTNTFTLTQTTSVFIRANIQSGKTFSNVKIYPQLEEGTATEYEPYGMYNKWYIERQVGKVVLNGSESWQNTGSNPLKASLEISDYKYIKENICVCNYFKSAVNGPYGTMTDNQIKFRYHSDLTKRLYICTTVASTTNDFKIWLSTHNTIVYYVLATPTYTEITDSELIGQLESIRLLEGLNNISITSDDLSSPLSIRYYSTDNEYYDKIYSQDERNDLKIWFNDVELEDAAIKCEKITRTARILPDDGNKVFSLDNFISTNIEVILHNVDLEDIQDQVKISIGTLMSNNTYKYIPLGVFNIQDTPTNDNGKITLKLRDNRVKFDFNYNGQELIEELGGSATKKQILDDICEKAGVTNTIDSFNGDSDLIGIYDNKITGTTYVSYLMEQAGLIPTIDREGNLKAIDLSKSYVWKIPLSILQTGFEIGEPYNIERVVYESGTIKYETSSDDKLNTLYLNILNPYITKNNQVEYILEKLHNFLIDSVTTKNVLGNPCIDPYDIIKVYNDLDGTNNIVFQTLANTTYTYNGTHRDIFNTQIGKEERKENVSLKGDATFEKYAKTSIDNLDGRITNEVGIVGNNLNELNKKLYGDVETQQVGDITRLETSITQKADSIEFNVYKETVDNIVENGAAKVQNTSVTINDKGLNVSTSTSKISTTMTNNEFKIIDNGGNRLAYFGYDETDNTSKAVMDNLTVTTYLNTGTHRIEKYEEDGEERTGFFYIGG